MTSWVGFFAIGFAHGFLLPAPRASCSRHVMVSSHPDELGRGAFVAASAATVLTTAIRVEASVAEPTASAFARSVDREIARKILQIERLNVDSNSYGSKAQHLPRLKISGETVECYVPMDADPAKEHSIEYLWLKDDDTDIIFAAAKFQGPSSSPPTLIAKAKAGTVVTPYAYWKVHGLWIGDSEQV